MSLAGFDQAQRGTLVLRWSPSGDLDRFVVTKANVPYRIAEGSVVPALAISKLGEDGTLAIGSADLMPALEVEREEGFGYTYIFTSGETFKLPEWIR